MGKASARLDDVVNLVPARLSSALMLIAGVLSGLSVTRALSMDMGLEGACA